MKKSHLQLVVLSVVFFLYSFVLISNYTEGDQYHYRALYDALSNVGFWDVLDVSRVYVNASDPLSFYILWGGSRLGVDKDIFISTANVVLLSCLYLLGRRYRVNYFIMLMLMSNFYIVVLMTGAERLKFAFIFIFLAVLVRWKYGKLILLLSSVFSHLQSIILLVAGGAGYFAARISENMRRGSLRKSVVLGGFLAALVGVVVVISVFDSVEAKAEAYMGNAGVLELVQIALFFGAGLIFLKNKIQFTITMFPLLVAAFILGGNRVNMIAVVLGVFLFWREGKANHPFMYAIMLYFSIKGLLFIENIMKYGNGFYVA